MVIDSETNFVYLSEKIKSDPRFPGICEKITGLFDSNYIQYDFILATNDIWARDYMPIQKDLNSFIQFKYEPSYLIDEPLLQSDPKVVCKANYLEPSYSDINLDGGNIIKWHDKVIISKRIINENSKYAENELISQIEKLLEARVIMIPDIHPYWDMTGHADGYVRFLDERTVLVNELKNEFKYWTSGFKKMATQYELDYIELPWFDYKNKDYPSSALGIYINYLEIGNLIILPIFEIPGNKDQKTYNILTEIFKHKRIETININSVGLWGGLMNCITWNIKKQNNENYSTI